MEARHCLRILASRTPLRGRPPTPPARDPRHKPALQGASRPQGPGAHRTHRLRSRPPSLCVELSAGSQLLLAGVQAVVARAGRRTRGSAAPPAGTAGSLPGPTHSGCPGAPPRRRPCGTSRLQRPRTPGLGSIHGRRVSKLSSGQAPVAPSGFWKARALGAHRACAPPYAGLRTREGAMIPGHCPGPVPALARVLWDCVPDPAPRI